jgi:hypothetical protein
MLFQNNELLLRNNLYIYTIFRKQHYIKIYLCIMYTNYINLIH